MAQDLACAKGVGIHAIMQVGGWQSEKTIARYNDCEVAALGAVVRFHEQQGAGR